MFFYTAYGLSIRSEIALPELGAPLTGDVTAPQTAAKAMADVIVRLGSVDRTPPQAAQGSEQAWACHELACFDYERIGAFRVSGGREITLDPVAGADERLRRLILLGPVLAVLLHQRGLLVLHASAVALQAGAGLVAVAFVGDKGAGKSTTAAALHARGHGLLCDDVVAVDLGGAVPVVWPGFPHLKLWPEAAASTLDGAEAVEALPRVHPDLEKRSRPAFRAFPRTPLPLAAVYALTDGERDAIEPAGAQETFVHLVRHSYLAQLLHATGGEAVHFRQSVQLARSVPVRRLVRRRNLRGLPALARLIEQDAAAGAAPLVSLASSASAVARGPAVSVGC